MLLYPLGLRICRVWCVQGPEGQATKVGFTLWMMESQRQRQVREAPLAGSPGLIDLFSELGLCKH